MTDKLIILFDGVCNLCNGYVNFLIDRDKKDKFRFAALQSNEAEKELKPFDIQNDMSAIIVIKNKKIFRGSTAILKIAKELKFPYNLLYIFIIVPLFIREPIYRFIAGRRYKWFGKRDQCRMPTPELKKKFL